MTKTNTIAGIIVIIGAILTLAAVVFFYETRVSFGASPTGSTFTAEQQASVTVNFATATSTFIQNVSGNDYYVTATKILCNGVGSSNTPYTGTGLASWQFTVGTSSTNVAGFTFHPYAGTMVNFAVATATPQLIVASSTLATATSSIPSIWPAGSFMEFQSNATNTAVCTIGVNVTGS